MITLSFIFFFCYMAISITPVLSVSAGYVSDVRDQTMALVRNAIMNPGFTSSLWEDKLISFRQLSAEYGHNRDELVGKLAARLSQLLTNKFTDIDFIVNIRADVINEVSYKVVFDITISSIYGEDVTEPALVSGQFIVDSNTYDITIQWNRSADTASLLNMELQ